MTLSTTTLNGAVSATSTLITLTSTASVTAGQYLVVGREAMRVTALVGPDAATVWRGVAGTPALAHPTLATVYIGPPDAFYARDPVGVPPAVPLVTPWINLFTGAVWTVVNGAWASTSATTASPADATQTSDLATQAAAIATLQGATDGLGALRCARATFDATEGKPVAAYPLGVTIPDDAVVVGGFVEVATTFVSANDSATIAVHINAANDLITATAISVGTTWDASPARKAIVPKMHTPESTAIKLTAARAPTVTVAVQPLTAGVLTVFLYYVQGA